MEPLSAADPVPCGLQFVASLVGGCPDERCPLWQPGGTVYDGHCVFGELNVPDRGTFESWLAEFRLALQDAGTEDQRTALKELFYRLLDRDPVAPDRCASISSGGLPLGAGGHSVSHRGDVVDSVPTCPEMGKAPRDGAFPGGRRTTQARAPGHNSAGRASVALRRPTPAANYAFESGTP